MNIKKFLTIIFSVCFMTSSLSLSAKPRKKPKKKNRKSSVQIDSVENPYAKETTTPLISDEEKAKIESNSRPPEKLKLTEEHLKMTHAKKRELFKRMHEDQFLDVMEDYNILYQEKERLKNELEKKNEELKNLNEQLEKLKSQPIEGSGEIANDAFIAKIKKEGIDSEHLNFRVQVGSFKSYKSAVSVEGKAKKLGLPVYIVVRYKGFVIPINLVLDHLKN